MVVKHNIRINQKGFSLLELVVAVGIVLVLSAVGLLSYSSFTDSARKTATENEAKQAYGKVMAYAIDNDPSTDPMSVDEEYNKTQTTQDKKERLYIHSESLGNGRYRVTAFMTGEELTESNATSLISSAKYVKTIETPETSSSTGGSGGSGEETGGTGDNGDGSGDGTGTTPPITEVADPNIENAFTPITTDTCATTPELTNINYRYGEYTDKGIDITTNQSFYVEFTLVEAVANCFTLEVDMNEFPIVPKTSFSREGDDTSKFSNTFTKVDDKWVINASGYGSYTFAQGTTFRYRIDGGNYDYKTIAKSKVAQSNPVVETTDGLTKSITFTSEVDFIANWKAEIDLSELEGNGKTPRVSLSYKSGDKTKTVGNHYTLARVSGKPGFYTIENKDATTKTLDKRTALPGKDFSRTIVFRPGI